MAEIIEMPKLSDTMEEGAVAKWLKKEGDHIEEGEAFVEIETDKATMEYNSPVEGTLLKIIVPAGKRCELNSPIAVVGKQGESFDLGSLGGGKTVSAPATAPQAPVAKAVPAPAAQETAAKAPIVQQPLAPKASPDGRLKSSPLARKLAAENNIDIGQVAGTGPNGRIVQRDIEAALQGGAAKVPAAVSAQVRGAAATTGGASEGDEIIPVTMMRKTIAKRLLAAKNDAPHFYLTVSVDMTKANAWRQRLNEGLGEKDVKVSVNDLIVLGVSRALRKHPEVNASWEGEQIRQWAGVHVAVAVALPTGLVTPVIRHTDRVGVKEIARQVKDLVGRAKSGSLGNQDYAGGTFTISNLGMFGIEEFTAIINPPQSAILAVGATMPTPWVNAAGEVVVQPRMKMTMSCDHRVVDGAVGAQFLKTLVGYLEDPLMMLS